ncbi:MAG: diacylglycerol kinase family lipid kinase [Termitinemataceae bacterium]|nr:MAG: diacylglycerol kinase family lipid kinase [Termitinemataceae bacterium]
MRHLFIINPISFKYKYRLKDFEKSIESEFAELPNDTHAIYISQYLRDSLSVIEKEIHDLQPDEKLRVYAAGGNGILFDCLNGIVGQANVSLACLPYGAFNDFVRSVGIERGSRLQDTISQLRNGYTLHCDIFKCNNMYALNHCAIGIEGSAKRKSSAILKNFPVIFKALSFLIPSVFYAGCLVSFFNKKLRKQYYNITIDNTDYSGNYANIFIANGCYYSGGRRAAPEAHVDDGLLNVVFCRSLSVWNLMRYFPKYHKGLYARYPEIFTMVTAKNITIHSSSYPLFVSLDGEVWRDTSLKINLVENGLAFIVPKRNSQ